MNSSLHTKEVTTARVRSVAFGFYSDEEASLGWLVVCYGSGWN